MKRLRRLLALPFMYGMGVWLLAWLIRIVYYTSRVTTKVHPDAVPYMQGERNAIFAFWHGRMMMIPCICPPGRKMHILISQHRDGILISNVMRQFRFHTIAGSTSRNGHHALRVILRALSQGENIAITPDGPRGPLQVASGGVAVAAKLSGKPVVPMSFSSTHRKHAKSWDRFMLALPFGRVLFVIGAPIYVDKQADHEAALTEIERVMNALTEETDAALL